MASTRELEDLHTVMIKNIPCRCSAEEVLRAVDSLGFAGTYDFFYLPMNRRHKQGIGYGFINFIELGTAVRFKDAIWGYRFPRAKEHQAGPGRRRSAAGPCRGGSLFQLHASGAHALPPTHVIVLTLTWQCQPCSDHSTINDATWFQECFKCRWQPDLRNLLPCSDRCSPSDVVLATSDGASGRMRMPRRG